MLVYASRLIFDNSPEQVLEPIFRWLSRKAENKGRRLGLAPKDLPPSLQKPLQRRIGASAVITIDTESDEGQALCHIQYSHPDNKVANRTWHTEVGLRWAGEDETEITIQLTTEDVSTRAASSPPEHTRPFFIKDLLDNCRLSLKTTGATIKSISEDDAREYEYLATDPGRDYPFVVVSPTHSGSYLVDLEWLRANVVGIADVVQISRSANTWKLVRALGGLGHHISAWNGAVAVVYPPVNRLFNGRPFIPVARFLRDELEALDSERERAKAAAVRLVLGQLCSQVSKRFAQRHISLRQLHDFRLRSLLKKLRAVEIERAETAGHVPSEDLQAAEALLEELQSDLEEQRRANAVLQAELHEYQCQIHSFEHRSRQSGTAAISVEDRDALVAVIDDDCSPEDVLRALKLLFPERVVILESALASSRDSSDLLYRSKAKKLLWILATRFWETKKNNDGNAHAVFPRDAYAISDSYKGSKLPKRARALRTFSYNGQEIFMPAHLKVGRGASTSEGLRVHFAWDDDSDRVVVGYCGKHLDTH